jgi:FAD/FMN-containing dehydrogenase
VAARWVLHKMPPVTRTVCLEFFGQARDAIPSIVEIKDYLDAETKKVGAAALDELMAAMEVDRREALRVLSEKAKALGEKMDASGIVETMRQLRQEWAE